MRNLGGPIWFLRDMSVQSVRKAGLKRISSVSVRSTLNLNHSKLTYFALAGLTNTVVKGKNNISAIYSLNSTKNIHVVLSHRVVKVKDIEILIRLSKSNVSACKFWYG